MSELAIDTKGLSKRFGKTDVLTKIDLQIPKEAVVCILGAPGSGKSSLFKLLMGEYQPSAGSGSVLGMDISQHAQAIRQRIGYMPQAGGFDPSATVQGTLDLATALHQHSSAKRDEALALVGLADKLKTRLKQLSVTELRKLALARAYVTRPALLLLDEPAYGLDPLERIELFQVILGMRANTTIVFSDEQSNHVETLADDVLFLIGGRIVELPLTDTTSTPKGVPADLEQVFIELLRQEKATP